MISASLHAAILGSALGLLACQGDKTSASPAPSSTATLVPASSVLPKAPAMHFTVGDVRGDPSIDIDGVRHALRDAEGAFLSCIDNDGSTGVIGLRIPVERNGAAGNVEIRSNTTYGSDDARSCVKRIVEAMRFPAPTGMTEITATLEVRPNRGK